MCKTSELGEEGGRLSAVVSILSGFWGDSLGFWGDFFEGWDGEKWDWENGNFIVFWVFLGGIYGIFFEFLGETGTGIRDKG